MLSYFYLNFNLFKINTEISFSNLNENKKKMNTNKIELKKENLNIDIFNTFIIGTIEIEMIIILIKYFNNSKKLYLKIYL